MLRFLTKRPIAVLMSTLAFVMTSLTTILALLPLLFYSGMGVELQLPLALAIIGGLGIGTIVSLYFIPIMFYFLTRKSQ